jgi:hypothetical protein
VRNRSVTIENLAAEAGLDVEELLIRSWDAGFEEIDDPGYVLRADEANRLRKLLGLPSPLQISRPQYWQQALGMDEASLRELLANAGLRMTPTARTLPKGAVRIQASGRKTGVAGTHQLSMHPFSPTGTVR